VQVDKSGDLPAARKHGLVLIGPIEGDGQVEVLSDIRVKVNKVISERSYYYRTNYYPIIQSNLDLIPYPNAIPHTDTNLYSNLGAHTQR
jgi:hypothetical protein